MLGFAIRMGSRVVGARCAYRRLGKMLVCGRYFNDRRTLTFRHLGDGCAGGELMLDVGGSCRDGGFGRLRSACREAAPHVT